MRDDLIQQLAAGKCILVNTEYHLRKSDKVKEIVMKAFPKAGTTPNGDCRFYTKMYGGLWQALASIQLECSSIKNLPKYTIEEFYAEKVEVGNYEIY